MMRVVWLAVVLLASCTTAPSASPDPYADHPRAVTFGDGANMPRQSPTAEPPPTTASAIFRPTPVPTRDPLAVVGDRLSVAAGDFDCDGRGDQLEFFKLSANTALALPTLARLTLATGDIHELALAGTPSDDAIRNPLIGIADVNADGCDDAIVSVGHGASTIWTSFLVYDGTGLRRVEEDGAPVTFLFGGSVRHGNAIECRRTKDAPEVVARGVSDYTSDYNWDLVEDVHRWSTKSRLVLWSHVASVIPVTTPFAMPPNSDRYWGLACGALKLGG